MFLQIHYFVMNKHYFWYDMVKHCVNTSLLFHHHLLSPCIIMCKSNLVQCIVSLFGFIVSNIVNEWNVILIIVHITILLFLGVK